MTAYRIIPQRSHSVAENIASGGLHDVFHELGAVGIQSLPFFRRADAFIGDTLAAEFVCADLRLHIGEVSAGWQRDKEHPGAAGKGQPVGRGRVLMLYGLHDRPVDIPPEFYDVRIGLPPSIYQRRKLVFGQAHLDSAHRL